MPGEWGGGREAGEGTAHNNRNRILEVRKCLTQQTLRLVIHKQCTTGQIQLPPEVYHCFSLLESNMLASFHAAGNE